MLLKKVTIEKNSVLLTPLITNSDQCDELAIEIRSFILKEDYNKIVLDLTEQDFFNGIKISVLIATYHFIEFLNKKIHILVNNKEIKKHIENLEISNINVIYKQEKESALYNIA